MEGEQWDDVAEDNMDPELVSEAIAEEIVEVRKHTVWIRVPIEQCYQETGHGLIKTSWSYVNKG